MFQFEWQIKIYKVQKARHKLEIGVMNMYERSCHPQADDSHGQTNFCLTTFFANTFLRTQDWSQITCHRLLRNGSEGLKSDLATTAFAVKPKKIKKCSTQHYACLATNRSKLQSMAVGVGQRTSSHALVLLNGLFHTVLLICWNHADACFHGIDWATKAWEERLESRWRLFCELVLHLLFGSLLHALLHATQQRCHCFKNKAGSVDCENADATKRLEPKSPSNRNNMTLLSVICATCR